MEEQRMRTYDMMRDKLKEQLETSKRLTLAKEFMDDIEQRARLQFVDEGIDHLIELFSKDSTGANVIGEAPVLAIYEGGEWTGLDFMEYYTEMPESLREIPKDRGRTKGIIAGRVSDAILVHEAMKNGIDKLKEYHEELEHLREDVLVQLFITNRLFKALPGEDQLQVLYNENREQFPGDFEEEREDVIGMYRDQMEEGGLENLTEPLKEKYPVVVIEENLRYVPRSLKG
jgi:hypothetical protein